MTPDQCENTRKALGWSREQLSAKSGVPVYVIQLIERPRRPRQNLPEGSTRALRDAFAAAGRPLAAGELGLRIIGLRPLPPRPEGAPPYRNRQIDVEIDGRQHAVVIRVSNRSVKLQPPLLFHPRADEIQDAAEAYLKGVEIS